MFERRTEAISGWVKFPIHDPQYRNSREGGMVVKLVVVDPNDMQDQHFFAKCCGGQVYDYLCENFVGDDRMAPPETLKGRKSWVERHYPNVENNDFEGDGKYLSQPYLAALVLGTTGWSGWHEAEQRHWNCFPDDLTPEGKALYDQLKNLYPHGQLHILTFLDT